MYLVGLHHGASSKDRSGVLGVEGKGSPKTFKCCLMVANLDVKQTQGCVQLGIFRKRPSIIDTLQAEKLKSRNNKKMRIL